MIHDTGNNDKKIVKDGLTFPHRFWKLGKHILQWNCESSVLILESQ